MDCQQLELPLDLPATGHPTQEEALERARLRLVSDQNRVALMAALYVQDGRDQREHPQHGLYTGLAEAFFQRLGQVVARLEMSSPQFRAEALLMAPETFQTTLEAIGG